MRILLRRPVQAAAASYTMMIGAVVGVAAPVAAQVSGTSPLAFAPAGAGALDPTFGIRGSVTTHVGGAARAVVAQPGGGLVTAGVTYANTSSYRILAKLSDGSMPCDGSFAGEWTPDVRPEDGGHGVPG